MQDNAIIIPVYVGHAGRFLGLVNNLASLDRRGVTIVFVATNKGEQLYFARQCARFLDDCVILNAEEMAASTGGFSDFITHNQNSAIINLKKLLALKYVFLLGAANVCVLDSDVLFLSRFNGERLFQNLNQNYSRNCIYGGHFGEPLGKEIIAHTNKFIFEPSADLGSILPAADFYSWFFDVPFYSRIHFTSFMDFLEKKYPSGWWHAINWHTFDFIIYGNFLLSQGIWKAVAYDSISPKIPEKLTPDELALVWNNYRYHPCWVSHQSLILSPEILSLNSDIEILYHTDRS